MSGEIDNNFSLRLGKFYLSDTYRDSPDMDKVCRILYLMKFIPARVEHLYHMAAFEYIGYSPFFEIKSPGEEIPVYRVIVTDSVRISVDVTRELQVEALDLRKIRFKE